MEAKNNIKLIGKVHLVCRKPDGSIKWEYKGKNKITNASLPVIAGLMGAVDAQTAFTYLAVGSGSTAEGAALTALTTEITNHGLARHVATVSRQQTTVANDTLQLYYVWTATAGGPDTINEIGIFNDPTTGTMLGRKLTGAKTVNNGETLTCTYQVCVTGD